MGLKTNKPPDDNWSDHIFYHNGTLLKLDTLHDVQLAKLIIQADMSLKPIKKNNRLIRILFSEYL